MDKDHIVPRADRASDSLDSLVITFSAVNKWKGKRTAFQFVEQEQGKPVPDLPNISVMSLKLDHSSDLTIHSEEPGTDVRSRQMTLPLPT